MTVQFPDATLDLKLELKLKGVWTPMTTVDLIVDDYWTTYYTTEWLGRRRSVWNRLLSQTISVQRGQAQHLDRPSPMQVDFVVDNPDGWLTPHNPASPWYPDVAQGLECRITVDDSVRFYGRVTRIAPSWPWGDLEGPNNPGESRVSMTARGKLHQVSRRNRPLHSVMYRTITRWDSVTPDDPGSLAGYWPLEDRGGTSPASPLAGVAPMAVSGFQFAADSSWPASDALPTIGEGSSWIAVCSTSGSSWAVHLWFKVDGTPEDSRLFTVRTVGGTWSEWEVSIGADTSLAWSTADASGGALGTGWRPEWSNAWVHAILYATQDGADTRLELEFQQPGGGGGHEFVVPGTLGRVSAVWGVPAIDMSIGHLAVRSHPPELDLTWLLVGLNYPETGYTGEPAGERLLRLAAEEGDTIFVFGEGSAPMGPQGLKTRYELYMECAAADGGLFTDRRDDSAMQYLTRDFLCNQDVALVLDAALEHIDVPLLPVESDEGYANEVEVQRTNGSSYTASSWREDDPDDLLYDIQIQMNLASDDDLPDAAGWELHLASWPGMRYGQVTVDLAKTPSLTSSWNALFPGARIQIVNLPSQHPTDTVDLIVLGYTEPMQPRGRKAVLNCIPAGPWTVAVLDDDELGRLGADGTSLASAVDATTTSIPVVTQAGKPPLIDSDGHPDDFPVDLVVDGERMTLTAATAPSGATQAQTLTVVRSVNDVEKPHSSGAVVDLWLPMVLAR